MSAPKKREAPREFVYIFQGKRGAVVRLNSTSQLRAYMKKIRVTIPHDLITLQAWMKRAEVGEMYKTPTSMTIRILEDQDYEKVR